MRAQIDDVRILRNAIETRVMDIESKVTALDDEARRRIDAQTMIIRRACDEIDRILNDAKQRTL